MATQTGTLALAGEDSRLPVQSYCPQSDPHYTAHAHDTSVTFEEYVYWAKITREAEKTANQQHLLLRGQKAVLSQAVDKPSAGKDLPASGAVTNATDEGPTAQGLSEKGQILSPLENKGSGRPTNIEWNNASRALRTAGWGAIFYLITTDILGPFSTPWAFAQMGYGPGIALYTVFGALSAYSGWILWRAYLGLDSDRYPLRGYGDFFFRIFGPAWCHFVNISQGIQLLFTVSVTILFIGQSVSQISQGPSGGPGICFIVCLLIVTVAGIVLGQIRTLQRFSWLAYIAVLLNCAVLLMCMGVAANSPPNFHATKAQYGPNFGPGPVMKFAGLPPDGYASGGSRSVAALNGLNQAVVAYGGAMLFVAFLAEMRQPMDFWKALICAELFIYVVYVFFGLFIYSYQGQFALNPAMQGLSLYNWQTAANVMNLCVGLIAAALYSNVGLKVVYIEVLQELFNAPPLSSVRGKIYWAALMPVYWVVAFVVCASVPMFSFISGLVGAVFVLSFSYTFPALIAIGYTIKRDAMVGEEDFVPATRNYNYVNTGFKRYWRAFKRRPVFNTWNTIYFFGAMVTCALGTYSSVVALISAFSGNSAATSWGCTPPV